MNKTDILWVHCDELRTDAFGCYGNRWTQIHTPNVDRIAEMGVRFDNCFCNSPVCIPSRMCNISGLYCEDTGVYNNEPMHRRVKGVERLTLLPEVFVSAGYRTANFGKQHLPKGLQAWQHHDPRGFHLPKDFHEGVEQDTVVRSPGPGTYHAGKYVGKGKYPPSIVTDNALEWLVANDGPVFARLSYKQPHTPVFPPAPFDELYADARFGVDEPDDRRPSEFEQWYGDIHHTNRLSAEEIRRTRVDYYGLVAWLDGEVGRLLECLERCGRLENTIIIFDADHGVSLGEGGKYGKQTFAPEVHRIPRLIAAPGRVPAGEVRDDICEGLDLGKTLFGLANIEAPQQFRGRDVFREPAPEAVFSTIGFGEPESLAFPLGRYGRYIHNTGWPRRCCVRTQQWRLDMSVRHNGQPLPPEGRDPFLCDFQTDPEEKFNLVAEPQYKGQLEELTAMLEKHLEGAVEGAMGKL